MKNQILKLTVLCIGFLTIHARATTHYVDINSPNPTPPYTSWSTAATNIQDAVNQTANGDSVLVNPGVYQSSGYTAADGARTAVVVGNSLTIQSVNGAAATVINGGNAMRCIYLGEGASLTGFTLTGGSAPDGGGVYCVSQNGAILFGCVITGNFADGAGGGVYQGELYNCTVSGNFAGSEYAEGGGAYDAELNDCMIISNSIFGGYGCGVYDSTITSSVIADNYPLSTSLGSEGGGAYEGTLYHCNITGNSAATGGGTFNATLVNCIDYFNTVITNYSGPSTSSNYSGGTITYTCTSPNPGGSGNVTADPLLASASHISLASPCRGAGTTADSSGLDIDGNFYADPPSMGCFEPYPGSELGNLNVAIITAATNWAPGFALPFQANISGPVYSNVWNFGDGNSVTNEAYVSHTWSAAGTYPVTLTAYNDGYPAGIVATQTMLIAVPSVYYVNLNNLTPVPPYITWDTAAVNIQDAVNVATPGSLVLVTNGPTSVYSNGTFITNTAAFYMGGGATAPDGNFYRVVITNTITVESVNGPSSTYIWGTATGGSPSDCVYLTNDATLSGFTITNFEQNSSYGQISATSTNAVITNCLMANYVTVNSGTLDNCSLTLHSGSVNGTLNNCSLVGSSGSQNSALNSCIISNNSGALGGVLNNCILVNNTDTGGGGGAATAEQGFPLILNNCIISNNITQYGAVYNIPYSGSPSNFYTNCILNNCILTRNFAQSQGGGAYNAELNNCLISNNTAVYGAGVEGGLLVNCTLIANSNGAAADGTFLHATLTNCTLIENAGIGGADDCTLDQCTIQQNTRIGAINSTLNQCTLFQNGGGASASALNNCQIISNVPPYFPTATQPQGGGANRCTLTNCVLAYNVATNGGGAYQSTLVNCTVIANGAITGGGVYDCTADNCIIYRNTGGDFYPNTSQYPLNYCCVSSPVTYGIRSITNVPVFVAPLNFHLQSSSPCINSGNNAYVSSATDLDGNPRIGGGTVDIGAYEYQTPTSVISYAYLQQYGLPTDGSVDFKDLDGTAFNVYQDWIAGLNPTNPASVLAMFTPVTTASVTVTWQSVSGIPYFLQRSTNLLSQPPFSTIQPNITGQANTTSYTDISATNNVPYFYRVGVVAP